MPITINARAANGITVSYHKAVKLEVDLKANTASVGVTSYTDEQAYLDGLPIAWMWTLGLPVNLLSEHGTLLEDIELALTTVEGSPFQHGEIVSDSTISLEAVKEKKKAEIDRSRLAANQSSFTCNEKVIAFDQLSFIDIMSTNGVIALTGAMPEDWLGGWIAKDGSFVLIPDVATWEVFYKAMYAQGKANFLRARGLKAAVDAAETVEEVAVIAW